MKIKDFTLSTPLYLVFYENITKVGIMELTHVGMRYVWSKSIATTYIDFKNSNLTLDSELPIQISEYSYICDNELCANNIKKKYLKKKLDRMLQELEARKKYIKTIQDA